MIDPGPDEEDHIRALSHALEPAREIRILLTHRHTDHAGGAVSLARATGALLFGPVSCRPPGDSGVPFQVLVEGDEIPTDEGVVTALEIPGHAKDHLAFFWEPAGALFVGDLMLGKGDTTWVGEYLGCVGDYLDSLDKVESFGAKVLYPGHGPPSVEPASRVALFRRHRLRRVEQVRSARLENPGAGAGELAALIYGGEIPDKLVRAAVASVEATLFHLDSQRD